MRIGIITQPLHNNYGGLLQNFALQHVLRANGHEPITIDWGKKRTDYIIDKLYQVKLWLLWLLNKGEKPKYNLTEKENNAISRNNRLFIDKYINYTVKAHSKSDFKNEVQNHNLDALVVGSDQVWRPLYSCGHLYEMFLSFAEGLNVKRVAYAASFGTSLWEYLPKQTIACGRLAKYFDLITVREVSAIELCRKQLGVTAKHVLDPTMLVDRSVYEKIVEDNDTPISKGNLLCYLLDFNDEKSSFVEKVGIERNLIPFFVMPIYSPGKRTKKNVKNEIEKCIFPGVNVWLRAFMDADMVICDSFHGCVFSIIFNKPFWVIANEKRGNARFESLLNTFGLQERLITTLSNVDISSAIDWDRVNQILEEKKLESKALLIGAL